MDDRADVHISSRVGRFYVGWFPIGRPGTDREGWKLSVTGTAETPGYGIAFDTGTPAEIVAAAMAKILGTSRPLRADRCTA